MIEKLYALRELVNDEDIPHPTVPEYKEHHASIQKILTAIDDIIASLTSSEAAPPQLLDPSSKSMFIYNYLRKTFFGNADSIYEIHFPGTYESDKMRYCLCYHTGEEIKAIDHIASEATQYLLQVNNVDLDSVLSFPYLDGEIIDILYGQCDYCKKIYFMIT